MLKNLLLLVLTLCSVQLFSQRNCGAMENLEVQIEQNPQIIENMEAIENATRAFIKDPSRSVDGIVTIPVVVHVVYNNSVQNISVSQINSQIDILNEDFRRLNSDIDNTWPQAADVQIEFCLASIDPNGYNTSGITRTNTTKSSFSIYDNDIKFTSTLGKDGWPSSSYMNLWVCPLSNGVLGYAQFPGGSSVTDGVVIDYRYFGSSGTATAPFDLGRTGTHEVGHWLNLRHIWGDGDCSVDDYVSDTPQSDAANYHCPTNHSSCGSVDMIQNYMDYTNDACMNLFTINQKSRMRALFSPNGARASLLTSGGCGVDGPTCEDGIQNGDETGVDCGGVDCAPCNNDCSGTMVNLILKFDGYARETSWTIKDQNNNFIAFGDDYTDSFNNSTISIPVCLNDGCYTFQINDAYGDGICCNYGNGSYKLETEDGEVLASGGSFGASEFSEICVSSSSCSDVVIDLKFDNYAKETSWSVKNSSNQVVMSGSGYTNANNNQIIQLTECLDNGCYTFQINDSYGDGICCSYGQGYYKVKDANGTVLASGGSFGSSETKTFCVGGSSRLTNNDISENKIAESTAVYPVPTKGILNIYINSKEVTDIAEIHVYNNVGNQVDILNANLTNGENIVEYNTANLKSGVFYVIINSSTLNATERFIVIE